MLSLYEISNKFERLNDCPVIDAISIYITETEDPYSINYMIDYYSNIKRSRSKYMDISNKLKSTINVDTPMKTLIKNKKMLCKEVAEYILMFHKNLEDMFNEVYEFHLNELKDMGLEDNYKIDSKSRNYIINKEFGKLDDLDLTTYILDEIQKHLSNNDPKDFYNITMNHFLSKTSKQDIKDIHRELYILVNNEEYDSDLDDNINFELEDDSESESDSEDDL